jgi:hypothetical protein
LAAAIAGGAVELLLDRPEQPLEASTASTATIVTPRIIPLPSTLIVTLAPRARSVSEVTQHGQAYSGLLPGATAV